MLPPSKDRVKLTLNIILDPVYRDANGCFPTAISRRLVGHNPSLTEIPPSDVMRCTGAGGKTGWDGD